MDPITILTALLPLVMEGGKYAVQKWLAPESVKPGTFLEFLQLRQLELDQFKAMQGGDGESYRWVAAVRQLQRPAVVVGVVGTWCVQAAAGEVSPMVANMASSVSFYLFGDRTLFYVAGKASK
ncbi:MAG TPA: hypothetical protein VF522_13095 [Ramlibacter sp.]|uniref:hypothetical protein n=1 Tax=Ramlibacter sp. TaxID=1917967 RepID=UPI002ED4257B